VWWCALAAAAVVVVEQPEEVPSFREATSVLWPNEEVDVVLTSASLPRFEVRRRVLFWITSHGTASREVESVEAAVLLMRSWSASPELAAGWTRRPPPPDPVPEVVREARVATAPVEVDLDRVKRPIDTRLLDDVFVGSLARVGLPVGYAVSGVGWLVGVQERMLMAQVEVGARVAGIRGDGAFGTFAASGLVGWSLARQADQGVFVRPYLLGGVEVQRRVERQTVGEAKWAEVLPVVSLGMELGSGSLGWSLCVVGGLGEAPYGRMTSGPMFHF
jgi:hypothetical protein